VARAQRVVEKMIAARAKDSALRRSRAFYLRRGRMHHLRRRLGKRVMKKLLFGSVALVALVAANAASAADMPVKAPPRVPVSVATNWTGCYINAGAGYGFFRQEQHAFADGEVLLDETAGGSGWLGKIGGGCDYQFSPASGWGNWVVGAFADYDFMDLRGHLGVIAGAFVGSEKESSAAAAGGRIGYLVTPQILTYVNGGWSSTRFDSVNFAVVTTGAASGFALPGHTFSGGFIGGGTEVAVAALPGLYWRNEYRYAGYGSADLQFSVNGVPIPVFNHESKNVQTITSSLVWKFH
jgi:outer membrane immunogenic protein